MKTWVIPDVHGCLLTLQTLVEELILPAEGDNLIFLGDLIDRGPASKGVMDYVMNLQHRLTDVHILRGNHEDYMIKVFDAEKNKSRFKSLLGLKSGVAKEWTFHGGKDTLKSLGLRSAADIPQHYIDWINTFKYVIEWENFLIVHAGFNFQNEDIFSDQRAMMWSRDYEIDQEKLGNRKIIHGHVPVNLEFIFNSVNSSTFDFIDLDNGVYLADKPGFGNLPALELNSMHLVVQPNVDF